MGLATCHTKKTRYPERVKIPLNIQKGFFPRVLSRRVRKRDDATSTRPVDPDRWTGNCPLSFCDAGSLSYVSEKSALPPFGSPFLPHTPPFLPPRPLSFLVCVCNRLAEGGGGFCANNVRVRPFGGFPNFYPLLTMKNVSRYSKNCLRQPVFPT